MSVFTTSLELTLSKIPDFWKPRRRSLTLASQQKSFLRISFARAGFFLLKGTENFLLASASSDAGGGAASV